MAISLTALPNVVVGAAISRQRADGIRPYKIYGGALVRDGFPIPPTATEMSPRIISNQKDRPQAVFPI